VAPTAECRTLALALVLYLSLAGGAALLLLNSLICHGLQGQERGVAAQLQRPLAIHPPLQHRPHPTHSLQQRHKHLLLMPMTTLSDLRRTSVWKTKVPKKRKSCLLRANL